MTVEERLDRMERIQQTILELVESLPNGKEALLRGPVNINVCTPDAETFQQSRQQIMAQMFQDAARFVQRNG